MKLKAIVTLVLLSLSILRAVEAPKPDSIAKPYASSNEEIAHVEMVSEENSIEPGKPFWIAFQFHISPNWHLYWKNPGEAGQGPIVHWTLPPGFQAEEPLWSAPERILIDHSVLFGYTRMFFLLVQIFPSQDLEIGSKVDLAATVDWLGCSTVCVPGSSSFRTVLTVGKQTTPPSKQVMSIFKQARKSLPIETRHLQAQISDGLLEMNFAQDQPFGAIKSLYFFPDQTDLLDVNLFPSWELSDDKKTIIVRIYNAVFEKPKVNYPFKGVLSINEESAAGQKQRAFAVAVNKPTKATKLAKVRPKSVDDHLEELESKVWYRRIMTDVSSTLRSELSKVLLWAFLGGILLNIMPCVLPVISLKLLHFVQLRGISRWAVAKHGILYSFGVLLSFWALATTIMALQAFGKVVGWGFQLQEPNFVAVLSIILFLFALSLFGVFEFGISVAASAGAWEQSFRKRIPISGPQPSLTASFFSGVLATLVATPCTGPLLGSAIGFAATLEPTYSFAVFSALGLGMAFPFLLASFFPALINLLPKPGRWMVTFKQLMGFFMLGTVLWLVYVLQSETQNLSTLTLLLSLFIVAIGAWIFGNWATLDRDRRTRVTATVIAIIVVLFGAWVLLRSIEEVSQTASQEAIPLASQAVGKEWEVFSQPRLDRLVQIRIPVFVDVGAKWCLTCQTNKLVLESEAVREAFVRYGVVKMYADWTTNDESVTLYLRSVGRNGVPVYALYEPNANGKPIILPELLTKDIVIEALKQARQESE